MNDQKQQQQQQQMMNMNMPPVNQFVNHPIMSNNNRYGMWPPPDQLNFPNPNPNLNLSALPKPKHSGNNRINNKNWKGKKSNNSAYNKLPVIGSGSGSGNGNASNVYNPPTLNELQQQNRSKARRYFGKKKFSNNHGGGGGGRSAPYAPRNTTSFLIRSKKAGGITSLVSPCPVTPAVLPTPIFSPSREVLVDMAKEEWGVDGYGSMKGLIRLRSNEGDVNEEDEEEEGGSSESDVEEHVEVERRLDHDLSRFEMIYPNYGVDHSSYNLENRVDDQDTHIAQLEEENLILKERIFLMEREFDDLRMRLQCLERQSRGGERLNEEVFENDSENDSESRGYGRSIEDNNEVMEENNEQSEDNNDGVDAEIKQSDSVEKRIQETEAGIKVANNEVMEENNEQFQGNNGDDAHVKQSDSVEMGLQAMEAGLNVANNDDETKGLDVATDVCMEETESVKENDDGAAELDKNAGVSVGGDGSANDEEKV